MTTVSPKVVRITLADDIGKPLAIVQRHEPANLIPFWYVACRLCQWDELTYSSAADATGHASNHMQEEHHA